VIHKFNNIYVEQTNEWYKNITKNNNSEILNCQSSQIRSKKGVRGMAKNGSFLSVYKQHTKKKK
jgi:hypothetical protein